MALQLVAQVQKTGGVAAYIDVEHALDPQYAKNLGVDIDNDFAPVYQEMKGKEDIIRSLRSEAKKAEIFHLCITPEGTRSLNADWKKGFYFIAQKAGIPILLYGLDYERKLIECTQTFIPTGDVEGDMRKIKLYFKDYKGKHPELFTIGECE